MDPDGCEAGSRTRKRLCLNQGDSKYCKAKKKRAHDASVKGRQVFKEHKNERTVSDKALGGKRAFTILHIPVAWPLPPAVTLPSLWGHGKDVSPKVIIRTRLSIPCHNCVGW